MEEDQLVGKKIKFVLQAILMHCMSIFQILQSLEDELQKMMNSYWWGNKCREAKDINWSAWDKLYALKEDGRMGFQNVFAFNLVMLREQRWRIAIVPN